LLLSNIIGWTSRDLVGLVDLEEDLVLALLLLRGGGFDSFQVDLLVLFLLTTHLLFLAVGRGSFGGGRFFNVGALLVVADERSFNQLLFGRAFCFFYFALSLLVEFDDGVGDSGRSHDQDSVLVVLIELVRPLQIRLQGLQVR
jgi:hypothetical protein